MNELDRRAESQRDEDKRRTEQRREEEQKRLDTKRRDEQKRMAQQRAERQAMQMRDAERAEMNRARRDRRQEDMEIANAAKEKQVIGGPRPKKKDEPLRPLDPAQDHQLQYERAKLQEQERNQTNTAKPQAQPKASTQALSDKDRARIKHTVETAKKPPVPQQVRSQVRG